MTRHDSMRHGSAPEDVHSITSAPDPHTEDVGRRMVLYSVQMGLRILCIVGMFVFDGWLRWVMLAGAALFPWFAVLIANRAADRSERGSSYFEAAPAGTPAVTVGSAPAGGGTGSPSAGPEDRPAPPPASSRTGAFPGGVPEGAGPRTVIDGTVVESTVVEGTVVEDRGPEGPGGEGRP